GTIESGSAPRRPPLRPLSFRSTPPRVVGRGPRARCCCLLSASIATMINCNAREGKNQAVFMVVSMLILIIELPESASLKDKRSVVSSVKQRLRTKFRFSCAEVDLLDSLAFAEIGAALVSNSREF